MDSDKQYVLVHACLLQYLGYTYTRMLLSCMWNSNLTGYSVSYNQSSFVWSWSSMKPLLATAATSIYWVLTEHQMFAGHSTNHQGSFLVPLLLAQLSLVALVVGGYCLSLPLEQNWKIELFCLFLQSTGEVQTLVEQASMNAFLCSKQSSSDMPSLLQTDQNSHPASKLARQRQSTLRKVPQLFKVGFRAQRKPWSPLRFQTTVPEDAGNICPHTLYHQCEQNGLDGKPPQKFFFLFFFS